jgi:hypothetical protein
MDESNNSEAGNHTTLPWNKGKLIESKPPLRPKHVWAVRARLQLKGRTRDFALPVHCRSDLDDWLNVLKQAYPSATAADRRKAHLRTDALQAEASEHNLNRVKAGRRPSFVRILKPTQVQALSRKQRVGFALLTWKRPRADHRWEVGKRSPGSQTGIFQNWFRPLPRLRPLALPGALFCICQRLALRLNSSRRACDCSYRRWITLRLSHDYGEQKPKRTDPYQASSRLVGMSALGH